MSDDARPVDDASGDLSPGIAAMLSRASVWDEPPDLADQVVAAIRAEVTAAPASLDAARRRRASSIPHWLTAVAAIAVVVAAGAVLVRLDDDTTQVAEGAVTIELEGTELAPGASASAVLEDTPAGLKILLDSEGLAGAAEGEMYEAWISDGTIRVSAGTFHLRRGEGPIELWAGTADPRFHLLTVTIEPIDGVAESSGRAVLKGEFSLAGD